MTEFRKKQIALTGLLPFGEKSLRMSYRGYFVNALKRDLDFEISMDDFRKLSQQKCNYCGDAPNSTRKTQGDFIIINGIDRIDNKFGYTLNNCVPCCSFCNYAKRNFSKEMFYDKINKIYNNTHGNS